MTAEMMKEDRQPREQKIFTAQRLKIKEKRSEREMFSATKSGKKKRSLIFEMIGTVQWDMKK